MTAPSLSRTVNFAASAVHSPQWLSAAYLLLSCAGLLVLGMGDVPFTVDLLNHATRLFIECNPGDPFLSKMWTVDYGIIPNLAIDLINLPLCGLVDPLALVRGAMILSLAGILLLVWRIHVLLHREPNAFVLLAPAMSFNVITLMGYLNYQIGAFLFLLFVWSVIRYRLAERRGLVSILLPNMLGALLFFCHVFALGLAGLFYFAMRVQSSSDEPAVRRWLVAGLWSAASFAVPLLLIILADRSGIGFDYTLVGKIRALWAVLLYASLPVAAVLVGLWSALAIWAFRERYVQIHWLMRLPLAFLVAFSLLLPSSMLNAVDLDSRSLVAVAYLAVAAIGWPVVRGVSSPARTATAIAAASLALVTVAAQSAAAIPSIREHETRTAELRNALAVIDPLQSVLLIADSDDRTKVRRQLYTHLLSLATRERRAFNPLEFSGRGMQPLRATTAFHCLDVPAGGSIAPEIARQLLDPETGELLRHEFHANLRYAYLWHQRFDMVAYFHFGAGGNPFPSLLVPVKQGSFFTLFDVRTRARKGSWHCGEAPLFTKQTASGEAVPSSKGR